MEKSRHTRASVVSRERYSQMTQGLAQSLVTAVGVMRVILTGAVLQAKGSISQVCRRSFQSKKAGATIQTITCDILP